MSKSFAYEVKVVNDPKFYGNAVRFASEYEAKRAAVAKMSSWTSVVDTRVVESADPATHVFTEDGKLVAIKEGQF